jgi:mono/diheme cytochrome c family protein
MDERTPATRRRPTRAAIAGAVLLFAFLTAGCGAVAHMTDGEGNATRGRQLFKMTTLTNGPGCGTCHTLANAGTSGVIGPNLDYAFGIVKSQGFHESTIRDVVRGQIAYPETETATGAPGMPANIVTGQDAEDIAQYVAQCAGDPKCPGV